jgi:murein peptide amidase A
MASAHDFPLLTRRWRAVCRTAGLRLRTFAMSGPYPLFYVETPALKRQKGVYLSAGIHGDEPASVQALIGWAEAQGRGLRDLPALIFPCLNPWGLVNNIRLDADGVDRNRSFHLEKLAFVPGWRAVLKEHEFLISLLLHEDYDGEGLYIYEVERRASELGQRLLEAARRQGPIDLRRKIDKFRADSGLIRRRLRMAQFRRIGYPEAIWLHLHHSAKTYTVEAPSEFALEQRVAMLRAVIEEALEASGLR